MSTTGPMVPDARGCVVAPAQQASSFVSGMRPDRRNASRRLGSAMPTSAAPRGDRIAGVRFSIAPLSHSVVQAATVASFGRPDVEP